MQLKASLCAATLVAFALMPAAQADEKLAYEGIAVVELKTANPSADVLGRPLAYPGGKPVVRGYRITLPPGKATMLHKHPVPLYAYILSGTLEVDYGAKGKHIFRPGDGFLEAVEWCHAGRAVGSEPVVLLSVYMGSAGAQNTVDCPVPGKP